MAYEDAVKRWAAHFVNTEAVPFYAAGRPTLTDLLPEQIDRVDFDGYQSGYCQTCADYQRGIGFTIWYYPEPGKEYTEYESYRWPTDRVTDLPAFLAAIKTFDVED